MCVSHRKIFSPVNSTLLFLLSLGRSFFRSYPVSSPSYLFWSSPSSSYKVSRPNKLLRETRTSNCYRDTSETLTDPSTYEIKEWVRDSILSTPITRHLFLTEFRSPRPTNISEEDILFFNGD